MLVAALDGKSDARSALLPTSISLVSAGESLVNLLLLTRGSGEPERSSGDSPLDDDVELALFFDSFAKGKLTDNEVLAADRAARLRSAWVDDKCSIILGGNGRPGIPATAGGLVLVKV